MSVVIYAIWTVIIMASDVAKVGSTLDILVRSAFVIEFGLTLALLIVTEFRWRLLPPKVKKWDSKTEKMMKRFMQSMNEKHDESTVNTTTGGGGGGNEPLAWSRTERAISSMGEIATRSPSMQMAGGAATSPRGTAVKQNVHSAQLITYHLFAADTNISLFAQFLSRELSYVIPCLMCVCLCSAICVCIFL